jgi:hypothetical protein
MYYPLIMSMNKQSNLLLDLYPNSTVAYSFRKLRSAYSGNCIRVRRNGDNAEQDIPFLNGVLDSASLLNFVGENFCTYSEDMTNSSYVKLNSTVVADQIIAPDGTLTADKVLETATTGTHSISRGVSLITIGINYNLSIYVKAGERTKCYFLSQVSGTLQQALIDLTNGSVSGSTFTNPVVVTQVGVTGWYRISTNVVSSATIQGNGVLIRLVDGSGNASYLGDVTKGLYVWGCQFTIGSAEKTYFKTNTTNIAGIGWIRTFYDQSGNSNDATNLTTTSQPQISNASSSISPVVYTDPSTGKFAYFGNNRYLNLTSSISIVQKMMHVEVLNRVSSTLYSIGIGYNGTSSPSMMYWDNVGALQSRWSSGNITHVTDSTTGKFLITTLRDASNNVKMYRNNSALTSGNQNGTLYAFDTIGKLAGAVSNGYLSEIILWKQDLESSLNGIQTNINNYYGIY